MTIKDILLHQMAACHNEGNWFVPVQRALDGLTAEQAAWSDGSSNNSIWQNVNHLIFWNERYLLRFQELELPKFEGSNDTTFEVKAGTSESEWRSATEKLFDILRKWRGALADATEEKLKSQLPKSGLWYEVISDINTHNAYHIGQIIHTRKLQGSWKPRELPIN